MGYPDTLVTLSGQTPAQRRTARRAQRRLARRAGQVALWSASAPPHPSYYTAQELKTLLGHPIHHYAPALRWLGWRRIVRTMHRKAVTLWLPPGSPLKPRPRGRPRVYACL